MKMIHLLKQSLRSIPTDQGEFQLCVYTNNRDDKEHLP
jgi:GTP cyclohydrolase II